MARDPVTIPLSETIESYGEKLDELTFKPPTAKEILASGYPYSMERNPRTGHITESVNMPAARLLLASMAAVPPTSIDMLQAVDLMLAMETMKSFFFYSPPKRSSPTPPPGDAGAAT